MAGEADEKDRAKALFAPPNLSAPVGGDAGAGAAASSSSPGALDELQAVVRATLETRGVLGAMRARLRAEVFHALDDPQSAAAQATASAQPALSDANLLLNHLIAEYLAFNNHSHTLSVFAAESGQPATAQAVLGDRAFLAQQLHVPLNAASARVPLLYSILALLQNAHLQPAAAPTPAPAAAPVVSTAAPRATASPLTKTKAGAKAKGSPSKAKPALSPAATAAAALDLLSFTRPAPGTAAATAPAAAHASVQPAAAAAAYSYAPQPLSYSSFAPN